MAENTVLLPTGDQYEIRHGDYRAVVTELGAALRVLDRSGTPIVTGFAAEEEIVGCRGQQLLPWPNRIRDGRWTWEGRELQLPINEVERGTALHGLASWVPWRLVEHTEDAVTQTATIFPQPGWPGVVEATITHRLDDEGLTVEVSATNRGADAVPFGYAAHPYLSVGVPNADTRLLLPAGEYVETDERLLPVRLSPVPDDGEPDLRAGDPLGDRSLDTAYTDLGRLFDGRWRAVLTPRDNPEQGPMIELWADESFDWAQVFTGSEGGIAIEPMTCGPDAFNPGPTHDGMIRLEPGEAFHGTWGIKRRI